MEHAITVGMVLWTLLAVAGFGLFVGVLFLILSVIAEGYKH